MACVAAKRATGLRRRSRIRSPPAWTSAAADLRLVSLDELPLSALLARLRA